MTQVSAVLLITMNGTPEVLFSTEDLPVGSTWHGVPSDFGYWTFRGDMFGSTHALVGDYTPTTADDLAGFGMAIPDGLLGMVEEPWISSDLTPQRVHGDAAVVSDKFLVAFLMQGQDELLPEMAITQFHYDIHGWYLPANSIVVAWKALPEFPVGML